MFGDGGRMRALRFHRYGPPEVLSVEEPETPTPADGEVLVEVHASAVNPSDVKMVSGLFAPSLPRTPGRDFAGIVVSGDASWTGERSGEAARAWVLSATGPTRSM
jgi:NADPH:quinone reductase